MKFSWQKLWPWACALLAGILPALALPPLDQSWLGWVGLIPLFAALWLDPSPSRKPVLRGFLIGAVAGISFFLTAFFWITSVTAVGWFFLALYLALYFGLWGAIVSPWRPSKNGDLHPVLSSRHNFLLALKCAAAWVAQEWLRSEMFSGFGWNILAVTQHSQLPIIQIADLAGTYAISFLLALGNAIAFLTVWRFYLEAGRKKIRPHFDFTMTMGLVVAVITYGISQMQKARPGPSLRVAMVQPNIPQEEKWDGAFADKILETYERLTGFAIAADPQLIIWPESATPEGIFEDQKTFDFVRALKARTTAPMLVGSVNFTLGSNREVFDYNSAIFLTDLDTKPVVYDKIHLVPFGEYIPFRKSFPLFEMIAGSQIETDFTAGKEAVIFQMPGNGAALGTLICFEDTLGELARRFPLRGAQLLVNITNDGWFKKTAASRQHLANAIFRTVENRRPMLRCANTGVTCVIDPIGRLSAELASDGDTFVDGILVREVVIPSDHSLTFYTLHGEWFAKLCVIATGLLLLPWAIRALRRKKLVK